MAGIWYRGGTVTVTNGSKKVTGLMTQWQTSTWNVDKGHTFYSADGKPYEVDYVESDTVLYLVSAYGGPTVDSQSYAIDITRTGTIPALSRQVSEQLAYSQAQYESWEQILTGTDMVTLTAPDGQQLQVLSISAMQGLINIVAEGQQAGVVVFQTLASLQAHVPTAEQVQGSFKVVNDSTTTKNGYYSYNGSAYVKDASLVAGTVSPANTSDAVSGKAVADYAAPIWKADSAHDNTVAIGLSLNYPNLHSDPTATTVPGKYKWRPVGYEKVNVGGKPAIAIGPQTSALFNVNDPQTAFPSGYLSAGCLLLSKQGTAVAGQQFRHMILQFDSGGAEIRRDTIGTYTNATVISSPVWLEMAAIPVMPNAAKIYHYSDGNANDRVLLTNFYIADGVYKGFRNPLPIEKVAVAPIIYTALKNMFSPSSLTDAAYWDNGNVTKTPSIDMTSNKRVMTFITANTAYTLAKTVFKADDFAGASVFSWAVNVLGKIGVPVYARILVIQRDSSGVELSRTVGDISALSTFPAVVSQTSIAIDAKMSYVEFYADSGNVLNAGFKLTDICLRLGSSAEMVESETPVLRQQNLIPSPNYAVEEIFGPSVTGARINGIDTLSVSGTAPGTTGARIYADAINELAPGKKIYFGCESLLNVSTGVINSNSKFDLVILFLRSDGSEISRLTRTQMALGTVEKLTISGSIPAACTRIQLRPTWTANSGVDITGTVQHLYAATLPEKSATIVEWQLVAATSATTAEVYVSTTGVDTNLGTSSSPVLTFSKAAKLLGGRGTIRVKDDGVYPVQSISGADLSNITIVSNSKTKPHIRAGTRQQGFVLTSGETDIYELTTTDPAAAWIWEGYVNDSTTLITDAEREPQHGGRTHRLEHTKLYKQVSLAALKTASRGYYYGSGKLYIKLAGSYASVAEAYITYSGANGLSLTNGVNVHVQDIVVDFGSISVLGSKNPTLVNMESIGSAGQGIIGDVARGELRNCRTAGALNDGQNFHNTVGQVIIGSVWSRFNCWSHDNGDDGESMHEHCVGNTWGGLYEYNADRGAAPSYGSHTSYYNLKTKYNGYGGTPSNGAWGEGIALVGENQETGTNGTSVECYNCVDVGSNIGYANHGSDAANGQVSSMRLYDCKSYKSKSVAYSARYGSTLKLHDCRESGALGLVEYVESGSKIEKNNTAALV
ncbi:hypothetical protein [Aeromonas sp. LsrichE-8G]|uniref:hypothetical protein n=1 Tax=Aeromonas sp. LsrichE-8G TaxID=2932048 RepID=UPI001FD1A5A6|nr:hypothetical protein [Aeromonas sp. LsrichE-8G]MCJ7930967.1 hypothetical protein [Aeromonas sp. LsrichE-8G]